MYAEKIDSMSDEIFRYLSFDQMKRFQDGAEEGKRIAAIEIKDVGSL